MSPPPIEPNAPVAAPRELATTTLTATLRIDPQPGPRHFQGVWLEHGGQRWIVDYRARELWRAFDQHEVIVTGGCFVPFGEAITATHFDIATLRVADPEAARGRFLAVGPERTLPGQFTTHAWPAGSKLAGSSETRFEADGTSYAIAGGEPAGTGAATVIARTVDVSPTYTATTGGQQLWIVGVHEPGWAPDPAPAPKPIRCPG
jgi:hypothetical protein